MKNNYDKYLPTSDRTLSLDYKITDYRQQHHNSLLNSIFLKLEYFYTYFSLLFFTDALAFRSLFLGGEGSGQATYETPIDSLIGLIRYLIYAATISLIILRFKMIVPIFLRAKSLLLLAFLAYGSVLWSDVPEFTTRYGLFVIGSTLFGIYFAGRYSFQQQLKFLAWVLATVALMSLFFTILLPGSGIEQGIHAGAWRGVFWHKNNLGRYGMMGVLVFCLLAKVAKSYQKLLWAMCGLCFCLLILSASKTALVVLFFSLILFYFCSILAWDSLISVPLFLSTFLLSCGVTLWVVYSLEKVLVFLGKGVTLSGRTEIWQAVMPHIWQRPYWGHGYAAFWLQEAQARYVRSEIGFVAAHAHNGFLDLILELGFVGLVLFLISFIVMYAQSIVIVKKAKSVLAFFPLLFLSCFMMYNLATSQVLQNDSLVWVVYVSLAFSLKDILRDEQLLKLSDDKYM